MSTSARLSTFATLERRLGREVLAKNEAGACDSLATGVSRCTEHRTAAAPDMGLLAKQGRETLHDNIAAFILRTRYVTVVPPGSARLLCPATRCYPESKKKKKKNLNVSLYIVLAEFGRYPLRFHWWQQNLRYHNRINNLPDDERLIQCAFVKGLHDQAYCFWSHKVQTWLQLQSTALNIEDEICVGTVIDNAIPFTDRLLTRLAIA